jgi:mRNA interferase RelE/StbE
MNGDIKIIFSSKFKNKFEKLDFGTRELIIKHLKQIKQNPEIGKPLRYSLKGFRLIRIGKYRLIYAIEKNLIKVYAFEHRKEVYR